MARRMRAALAAALVAVTGAWPVAAQEWSLSGVVSQRVEADTNKRVDPDDPGSVIGFTTGLDLAVEAQTQRATWSLDAGLRGARFFGEGADEDLDRLDPNLRGSVVYQGKVFQTNAGFSYARSGTSVTEFEDSGIVDQDVTQTTVALNAGLLYLLDPRNTLGLSGFSSVRRFSEEIGGLSPSETVGVSTTWSHDLTKLTSTDLTLGLRQFHSESVTTETDSRIVDLGVRLNHIVSAAMTIGIGGGVSLTNTERDAGAAGLDEQTAIGLNGDARVSYRAKDSEVTLTASQGVEPSANGDLQNRSRIGAVFTQRLDTLWRLALATSYSRQTGQSGNQAAQADDQRQSLSFSSSVSAQVTRDWRLEFGYALRLTDAQAGEAVSNNLFVGISRDLAFLP